MRSSNEATQLAQSSDHAKHPVGRDFVRCDALDPVVIPSSAEA
jgi:hypothetical protein